MCVEFVFFFFKQKTAYEMRISDWSSDVCSSDLPYAPRTAASFYPTHGKSGAQLNAAPLIKADFLFRRYRRWRCNVVGCRFGNGGQMFAEQFLIAELDDRLRPTLHDLLLLETGRASCRERVCQSV